MNERASENIRELRESENISLDEVSALTDISEARFSEVERGEDITLREIELIADALDVSTFRILREKDYRKAREDFLEPINSEDVGFSNQQVLEALNKTYELLDTIDFAFGRYDAPPLAIQFEDGLASFSTMISEMFTAALADAADERYEQNSPHTFPDIVNKDGGEGIEIKVALETNYPKGHLPKEGIYLTLRYVLGDRSRNYNGNRGDTAWIWEVKLGKLEEQDFRTSDTEGDSGKTANISADAFNQKMERLYFNPNLCPYSRYPGLNDSDESLDEFM